MSLGQVTKLFEQEPVHPPNAVVTVTTKDGEKLSAAVTLLGHHVDPAMKPDEMDFKFEKVGAVDDDTLDKMGECSGAR